MHEIMKDNSKYKRMGQGYQMPGQGMPMQDPSRPPGM